MKQNLYLPTIFILCCIFSGCISIANKEDLDTMKTEFEQKIATEQEKNQKKYQEILTKIEGIQKIQEQQQTVILSINEEIKNQIGELKIAMDDSYQNQKKEFDIFKKSQEEKNFQFGQDIDTVKKAQNELLRTSISLTDSMVNFQKDILALKTSMQQIASEFDALNVRNLVQRSDLEILKKYYDTQIETLLKEIVRQESEIFSLKQAIQKKQISHEDTEVQLKKLDQSSERYHIVKKGETLSSIAKKYNTSTQKIKEINKIKDDSLLVGQKLLIP